MTSEAPPISSRSQPRWLSWRWRIALCIGVLVPATMLLLTALPTASTSVLGASANSDLFVLNRRFEVLRYDSHTGAFLNSATPNIGGYPAPSAPPYRYMQIYAMAVGPDNNLYTIAASSEPILRFNPTTGALLGAFIVNENQPPAGQLSHPYLLTFGPDGDLYVADDGRIVRYDGKTGTFKGIAAGELGPYPAPGISRLGAIMAMAFGPDGKLYIESIHNEDIHTTGFIGGEPVSLWYNTPDGRAVASGQVIADLAGAISSTLAPSDVAPGAYSLVAHGTWSAMGPWQIE